MIKNFIEFNRVQLYIWSVSRIVPDAYVCVHAHARTHTRHMIVTHFIDRVSTEMSESYILFSLNYRSLIVSMVTRLIFIFLLLHATNDEVFFFIYIYIVLYCVHFRLHFRLSKENNKKNSENRSEKFNTLNARSNSWIQFLTTFSK